MSDRSLRNRLPPMPHRVQALSRARIGWLALAACAGMPSAQAFDLVGTFTGTADAESLPLNLPSQRPESDFDGAAVQGRFEIHVEAPNYQVGGNDFAYFINNGATMSFSYLVAGERFDFETGGDPTQPEGVLLLERSATSADQSVTFLTDFMPKYDGATLRFGSVAGGLFDGLDATGLRIGNATSPLNFSTSFASGRAGYHVSVLVSSLSIGSIAPVPEPALGALFGLGGLLVLTRTRPKRPRR